MGVAATYRDGEGWSEEQRALVGIWSLPGIGPRAVEDLLHWSDGSLAPLLDSRPSEWVGGLQVTEAAKETARRAPTVSQLADLCLTRAHAGEISICFKGDDLYPAKLAEISNAPPLLFFRGEISSVPRKRVGLVGTRHPDPDYLNFAGSLAGELAAQGVGIVSGGAVGIDQACHQGALNAEGESWAFLGSGLDEVDSAQRDITEKLLDSGGAVFSEYPPGVRGAKPHFPLRNRLISGSSDLVVVIRAPLHSGALSTAEWAFEQGRELFAVPGDVMKSLGAGCNRLLQLGTARACVSAEELLKSLGLERDPTQTPAASAGPPPKLSPRVAKVHQVLGKFPVDYDQLLEKVGCSSSELTVALVELQLLGLCVEHTGRRYERV